MFPGSDWTLVVQTQLYCISYSSPFIHCAVLRLLLAKICKAVEFDLFQNKLRCTVLAALSSRAVQQPHRSHVMLTSHRHSSRLISPHTHTHLLAGPLFPSDAERHKQQAGVTVFYVGLDVLFS